MFTGLITSVTQVISSEPIEDGLKITFQRPADWHDIEIGESISTDGVCLTVHELKNDAYSCVLVPETLARTSFGKGVPHRVNLERALKANERLGGHFVQGHVDSTGQVSAIDKTGDHRLSINYPENYRSLVIGKGSITVNGVSLTVAAEQGKQLTVALIPHTLEHTTLGELRVGDVVNLEFDILGKYVARSRAVETEDAASKSSDN